MNCPNCGAQMQPGPIRGQNRCRYCETIVDERLRAPEIVAPAGPFALFSDSDGDGTPDFVQMATSMSHTQVETSYEINGKHYASLEEVPEEYRKLFPNPAPGSVAEQRIDHTESRASWSPSELERAEFGRSASGPGWLKPFVLGMLAAALLGWLLFD